jgi:hypothetical protein
MMRTAGAFEGARRFAVRYAFSDAMSMTKR